MNKKQYLANFDAEIFEEFKSSTRENGFKQMNEPLEILMKLLIEGKIKIKKERKDVIDITIHQIS